MKDARNKYLKFWENTDKNKDNFDKARVHKNPLPKFYQTLLDQIFLNFPFATFKFPK
jgi:hypothetical protein